MTTTTKSKILSFLEGHKDEALSGSAIAKSLKISRSAVWKAIEELRKEGYQIDAVTNKGYTLSKESDIISKEGLLHWMHNSYVTDDKIHVYKSIGSTNQVAKKMAVEGAEHGTLIIAEEQTEGRGRRGRSFYSPKDTGIYMSLILRPSDTAFEAVLATTAAAVAVSRSINDILGLDAKVKWVNDIFVNGLKVSGILAEAVTDFQTGCIEFLVIGIGINVMTDSESFPEDIRKTAGSLVKEPGKALRNRLAATVIDELLTIILHTSQESMMEEYRSLSFLPGELITVYRGNDVFDAKAIDIDSQGGLIIRNQYGELETLRSGEVSVRQGQLQNA